MDKFLILIQNNMVRVYDEGETQFLKKEGEEAFAWDENFWDWFVKKIEYDQNEPVSIVVISDKTICIPQELRSADKAFTFYLKDWKVKVYDDREKKYFQKDGEEEFVWDRDFWDWFVKKIEYTDNEPINLIIIVNDTDDFGLTMSCCQMIAENFFYSFSATPKSTTDNHSEPKHIDNPVQDILSTGGGKSLIDYFVKESLKYRT